MYLEKIYKNEMHFLIENFDIVRNEISIMLLMGNTERENILDCKNH